MNKLYLDPQKIRIAMARAVLDNAALAKKAGWSVQWANELLTRIKDGKGVGTRVAGIMAQALNVDVTEILRSENDAVMSGKAA